MALRKTLDYADLDILVCDDDALILQIMERLLTAMGIVNLYTTGSPKTALQLLKEPAAKPFDIFICDWMMPEMTGLDMLRKIRASGMDTAFIMLTGQTSSDAVTEAAAEGVDAYIGKPFTAEEVQQKISVVANRVLRGKS